MVRAASPNLCFRGQSCFKAVPASSLRGPMQVASKRCGLATRTGFLRAKAEMPLRDGHTAPLGNGLVLKCRCGLDSPHQLEAASVLKCRCGLRARTSWKQLWCSNAAAGCQPALLESSFGAQMPLRAGTAALNAAAGCRPAPLGISFGAEMPLRAASPHSLEAALLLKCRCGCQPAPLGSSFGAEMPLRAESPHRLGSSFESSNAAAGCQPARLGSSFGAQMPLRAEIPLERGICGQMPLWAESTLLGSSFRAQMPLLAASTHRLAATLVLKWRCGLPARTAWKQLWCSSAAAGCHPAPLGNSIGAQMPLRAASPHGFKAAFVVKCHWGLRARTAWKQLWCSNAAAGCQPAPLGCSFCG